jgi:predicted dehydrogenase
VFGEVFYLEADYVHNLHYQGSEDRYNPHIGGINWYLSREIPMVGGGVHPLDLLRWFAASPITQVHGYGNNIAFPQMQSPDCMVALFSFASGACAKVASLYGPVGDMAPLYNLAIYGTKATFRQGRLMVGVAHDVETTDLSALSAVGHPYEPEVAHFADCIINDRSPLVDAPEGANSAAACILAAEAIRSGRPQAVPDYK